MARDRKAMKNAGKVAYTDENGKEIRFCLCGCDEPMITATPKTKFRPGHDARMVRVVRRELKGEIALNDLQEAYVEWRELRPYVQARLDREARQEAEKLARKEAADRQREQKRKEKEADKARRIKEKADQKAAKEKRDAEEKARNEAAVTAA